MNKPDTFINYTIDMEATGNNIRNLMRITGYSARELEKLIGCTQMTFFNWQNYCKVRYIFRLGNSCCCYPYYQHNRLC